MPFEIFLEAMAPAVPTDQRTNFSTPVPAASSASSQLQTWDRSFLKKNGTVVGIQRPHITTVTDYGTSRIDINVSLTVISCFL